MITIYFKACPKCKGDLEVTTDEYHTKTLKCFQCAFMAYIPDSFFGKRKKTVVS